MTNDVIGVTEGKNSTEKILEKLMAKDFPKSMKDNKF